jgi:hypothetical protein
MEVSIRVNGIEKHRLVSTNRHRVRQWLYRTVYLDNARRKLLGLDAGVVLNLIKQTDDFTTSAKAEVGQVTVTITQPDDETIPYGARAD